MQFLVKHESNMFVPLYNAIFMLYEFVLIYTSSTIYYTRIQLNRLFALIVDGKH